MLFEWNPTKASANLAKHGVDFDDAIYVLQDPFALEMRQVVNGEERWRILGMVDDQLLTVVVQYKETGDDLVVRMISARRATRHERKDYHETHRL